MARQSNRKKPNNSKKPQPKNSSRKNFKPPNIQWTREQRLTAAVSFLVPLAVYIYFLCPTIAAGDSGELVTTARTLGVPHPPGYPLFTMIGHIFTGLPFNSIAWRVNLASALLSALCCFLVYLSLLRLTGRVWAALAGALGLAFSRYYWHYSEVAEVFPLNNLFAAALTYILILVREKLHKVRRRSSALSAKGYRADALRLFWLFAFLYGLALTNHQTIILLAPAVLFFLWKTQPELLRPGRTLGVAAALFLLGLSAYLYCPLAALSQPVINWDNPVTLKKFLRLVSRADYGSLSLYSGEGSVSRATQLPAFIKGLYWQFALPGVLLGLLGLSNFKRDSLFNAYLLGAFFFSGIFFVVFANMPINNPLLFGVLHRFYILPAIFFAFWVGFGVDAVERWLEEKKLSQTLRNLAAGSLLLLLVVWAFVANVEEADFRENYVAEDFAHNLLMSLPENALFFVRGDVASMGVDYLQAVEGRRPDVTILDQAKLTYGWYYDYVQGRFPEVTLPGERYDGARVQNRMFIEYNIDKFPVCFMDFKEDSYQRDFRAMPHGLVFIMLPKTKSYSVPHYEKITNDLYAQFRRRGLDEPYPATTFEHELQQIYTEPFFRLAYEFDRIGELQKAEAYYKQALQLNPVAYKVMKNLAVLYYYKMNRREEAVELFRRYLALNPYDVEAHNIREVIRQFERSQFSG